MSVRDRLAVRGRDGNWHVEYFNERRARIADDGRLVYFVTPLHYFVYRDVFAFIGRRDSASKPSPEICGVSVSVVQ